MKNKYVMISGFAFSEETDMEKLKDYASKGWILEDIVGGLFYKLRKDKPQNIVYSLDYQTETNEEYFSLFEEAGWKLVVSTDNYMQIFSAQAGTKPIYSDRESEIEKYTNIRNLMKKGALFSFLIAIVLSGLLACSFIAIKPIFLLVLGLLLIDIVLFVITLMPYFAYNYRIKQIKKYGVCDDKALNNGSWWVFDGILGVLWIAVGVWHFNGKLYLSAAFFVICGIVFIITSLVNLKKCKKSL